MTDKYLKGDAPERLPARAFHYSKRLARVLHISPQNVYAISNIFRLEDQSETEQSSEERAAAVARYFLEVNNIPMRRTLVPVGYGATHPFATNQNAHGRDLNRHVDIKVLVNKA